MKPHPLLLAALLACTTVHAEWLTLTGAAGDPDSNYVQVDPTSIEVDGQNRNVTVRVSLAQARTTTGDTKYRSYVAQARIDCEARSARYTGASYFAHPNFVGDPVAVKTFDEDDVRPMAFSGAPGDLAARMVNAACSVGGGR